MLFVSALARLVLSDELKASSWSAVELLEFDRSIQSADEVLPAASASHDADVPADADDAEVVDELEEFDPLEAADDDDGRTVDSDETEDTDDIETTPVPAFFTPATG